MIIDGHIHYSLPLTYDDINHILDLTNVDKACLVSLYDRKYASANLDCLLAKYKSKGRLYVYGALDNTIYLKGKDIGINQAKHVKELMSAGCDGIKMLEGKPSNRKRYPIPDFDSIEFEPYFDYLEKNNINVTWHVNDPEEFWDINQCPEWAKKSGWFYDETYINNESQYTQIENVLKRHPLLRIHFAHFYFLSAQLDRLSLLFDNYPNIGVDITPGIELFTNASKNIVKARQFFIKYQDRINYGTDISGCPNDGDAYFSEEDSIARATLCLDFLTKEKVFLKGSEESLLGKDDLNINGLALDQTIVQKIMGGNFYKQNGEPKPINIDEIEKEKVREKERIDYLSSYYQFKADYSHIDMIKFD